jgi:phosphoserine phosphatase RsbU/P
MMSPRLSCLTETVRSAVRALTLVLTSPEQVLAAVNRLLLQRDGEFGDTVTVLLARLEVGRGEVSLASAGHPPPVHISANGCDLLELPYGLPLGAFDLPYTVAHVRPAAADMLVLYTDGLSDARRGNESFGEQRLVETLVTLRGLALEQLTASLGAAVLLFASGLEDDLPILTLRLGRQ